VGRARWETLRALSAVGAAVPGRCAPRRGDPDELRGDEDQAAPQLHAFRSNVEEARDLLEQLLRAIERMLYENVIHGDLSAVQRARVGGRRDVIDFPQAVDPRKNRHAAPCSNATSHGSATTSNGSASARIPRIRATCGPRGSSPTWYPRSCDGHRDLTILMKLDPPLAFAKRLTYVSRFTRRRKEGKRWM
jgi:hypothetical protein